MVKTCKKGEKLFVFSTGGGIFVDYIKCALTHIREHYNETNCTNHGFDAAAGRLRQLQEHSVRNHRYDSATTRKGLQDLGLEHTEWYVVGSG